MAYRHLHSAPSRSGDCSVNRSRAAARTRLDDFFRSQWTIGDLVAFHTREKHLVLAHDEATYRMLRPLVAAASSVDRPDLEATYRELFDHALSQEPTVGSHTNVLQHLAGFFRSAPDRDRRAVLHAIDGFRMGTRTLESVRAEIADRAAANGVDLLTTSTYLQR